jgi:hypothetical protein
VSPYCGFIIFLKRSYQKEDAKHFIIFVCGPELQIFLTVHNKNCAEQSRVAGECEMQPETFWFSDVNGAAGDISIFASDNPLPGFVT